MTHYEDDSNELEFITKPQADIHYINSTGDNMKGALDMGNNRITNLANPTNLSDAASKSYVDNHSNGFILKEGGELASDLDCKNNRLKNVRWPQDGKDAVSRNFVTSYSLMFKALLRNAQTGESTGDCYDAKDKRISDVAECTADKDAANKHYVDTTAAYWSNFFNRTCFKIEAGVEKDMNNMTLKHLKLKDLEADLDVSNHKVINVRECTDNLDAANKGYVDTKVASSLNSIPVPSSDTSAVSKQWVSTFVGSSLTSLDSTGLVKVLPFFYQVHIFNTVGSLSRDTDFNVIRTIYQSNEVINLNCLRIDYQIQHHRVNEENAIVATLEPLFTNKFYSVTSCKLRTISEGHTLRIVFTMKGKKGAPHIFYMQGTVYMFKDPIVLEEVSASFRTQTRSETGEEEEDLS